MSNVRHIKVIDDDDGQRLDRWLKKRVPELPYGLAQKLMRTGQIRVEGKRAKAETRLAAGQEVRLPPMEEAKDGKTARKLNDKDIAFIKSLVIFDDGDVIALNKPAGLSTQGGTKTRVHIDGFLDGLKNKDGVRPRLVHRLDKDTSGILLLARSAMVATRLGNAFKGRDIKKIYWALVSPAPSIAKGTIKAAIIKSGGSNRERMVVDEKEGKKSVTEYSVIDKAGNKVAFAAFWPRTGRTHQIRVHAEIAGFPLLGDNKYRGLGLEKMEGIEYADRLHLHARRIILRHPVKNSTLDITAPLPEDLIKSWKALGFNPSLKSDPFADLD